MRRMKERNPIHSIVFRGPGAPGESSVITGLMTALRQVDISGKLVKEEFYDAAMDIENFRARCRNRNTK